MASFMTEKTDAQNVGLYENISSMTDQRNQQRNMGYSEGGSTIWGYDVVGINTSMIPQMRQAIRTYVDRVYAQLDKVQTNTDPTIALKGTGMENAVTEYVENVVKYCKALCSNLLAFSDKLVKVEEAWRTSDQNMSSKVNSGSSELNSAAGQTYTEKFMG